MVKLWVDDLRDPPNSDWSWAKTSVAAIDRLGIRGDLAVDEMSLDHDLGGDDTTRPIVLWLCENPEYWPRIVRVHSSNPPGAEWLVAMCRRYAPASASVSRRLGVAVRAEHPEI